LTQRNNAKHYGKITHLLNEEMLWWGKIMFAMERKSILKQKRELIKI
jgi:hypothetical protein